MMTQNLKFSLSTTFIADFFVQILPLLGYAFEQDNSPLVPNITSKMLRFESEKKKNLLKSLLRFVLEFERVFKRLY